VTAARLSRKKMTERNIIPPFSEVLQLNHIVVLKPQADRLTYYFLAAWEQEPGGIRNGREFQMYLDGLVEELDSPLQIDF